MGGMETPEEIQSIRQFAETIKLLDLHAAVLVSQSRSKWHKSLKEINIPTIEWETPLKANENQEFQTLQSFISPFIKIHPGFLREIRKKLTNASIDIERTIAIEELDPHYSAYSNRKSMSNNIATFPPNCKDMKKIGMQDAILKLYKKWGSLESGIFQEELYRMHLRYKDHPYTKKFINETSQDEILKFFTALQKNENSFLERMIQRLPVRAQEEFCQKIGRPYKKTWY